MSIKRTTLVGIGQRPCIPIAVVTREGKRYDLGKQVEGDDLVARYYQWQQRRKIRAYCKDRAKDLSGQEREDFLREVNKREAHSG